MVLSWAPGHEPAGSLGCGVAVDATLGELAFDGGDLEAVRARLLPAQAAEREQRARSEEHGARSTRWGVGPLEDTPQHLFLFDFDDPDFGSVDFSCPVGGDWGDYDRPAAQPHHAASARHTAATRSPRPRREWEHGPSKKQANTRRGRGSALHRTSAALTTSTTQTSAPTTTSTTRTADTRRKLASQTTFASKPNL